MNIETIMINNVQIFHFENMSTFADNLIAERASLEYYEDRVSEIFSCHLILPWRHWHKSPKEDEVNLKEEFIQKKELLA